MKKSACIEFFEKYLCEVSKGRGYREHENPAIRFSEDVKAGKYNDLSDASYEICLREVKDMSAFWLNQPKQTASDLLQFALENIDIDNESLHKMAEILSECYASSVNAFVSEELFPKPKDAESKDAESEDEEPESEDFEEIPEADTDLEEKCFEETQEQESSMVFRRRSLRDKLRESETAYEELNSPKKIYEYLSKRIYGQKEAVRAAAMLLYNHMRGIKRNLLFIGQTGSGKTEIWKVCKQLYPNIHIIDSTVITGEGWSGSFKVNDIFNNMGRQAAESAVIVFDEFDKLCEPKIGSSGSNYSLMVQNELLKLIEGTTVRLKKFSVDTSKISFIFCGSFERLTEMKTDSESGQAIGFGASPEKKDAYQAYKKVLQPSDLVRYAGVRQEIVGRINQIIQLSPMMAEDYKAILEDELISPLHQLEQQYGVKLCLDGDTEQKLVQEAEATRMGVRYLRSRIQQMLDEQMFQDCERTEYRLSA